MYAEIIYETGSKSVVKVDSESELREALEVQHRRAIQGQAGGPGNHAAERVKRVLFYDEHPADYNPGATVSVEKLTQLMGDASVAGEVSVAQVDALVRDEASPVYPQDQGRHESIYKAPETGEMDLSFLEEVQ